MRQFFHNLFLPLCQSWPEGVGSLVLSAGARVGKGGVDCNSAEFFNNTCLSFYRGRVNFITLLNVCVYMCFIYFIYS